MKRDTPLTGEATIYDHYRVTAAVASSFRRKLTIEALEVHEREGCPTCSTAIALWGILGEMDNEDYVTQLKELHGQDVL